MLHLRHCFLFLSLCVPALLAQRSLPVENEFVRVVSVVDQHAPKPGAVHEHQQNRVMIYLDPGEINIRYADGSRKDEDQKWKAGDIAWNAAGGRHTSQHVSDKPTRIVEIELRKPGSGKDAGPAPRGVVLDNAQVRVYRASAAPASPETNQGMNYIAVDMKTAETLWNRLPAGSGPFVITLLK